MNFLRTCDLCRYGGYGLLRDKAFFLIRYAGLWLQFHRHWAYIHSFPILSGSDDEDDQKSVKAIRQELNIEQDVLQEKTKISTKVSSV